MTPDIVTGTHAIVGMDLHFADTGISECSVNDEAVHLAGLPARVGADDPRATLVGMALDVAGCREGDGSITSLFVSLSRLPEGDEAADTFLNEIEQQFPIFGPELVYAWSRGYRDVHFSAWHGPESSFRAALGTISNHERLEIRKAAIEAISKL